MSFFGFENQDLENERRKYLEGQLENGEDVAVFTWGEQGYDGLGDALQEGGDELNDETFGGSGAVGKDFDFTAQSLPGSENAPPPQRMPMDINDILPRLAQGRNTGSPAASSSETGRAALTSLESLWDDKSPLSVLPRNINGASVAGRLPRTGSGRSNFSPFNPDDGSSSLTQQRSSLSPQSQSYSRSGGIRTLQDIEAELRAQAGQSRGYGETASAMQQRHQDEILQLQLLQQEQERERERRYLAEQQHRQYEEELARQATMEEQRIFQIQRLQQQQRLAQESQRHVQHTPPPRMMPPTSQSPRFMDNERQRQIMLLQQQREIEHQQRLVSLQEQLRAEEFLRKSEELQRETELAMQAQQLRAQQQAMLEQQSGLSHQRQSSGPSLEEITRLMQAQALQNHQRQRSQSPAYHNAGHTLSHEQQLQQRLLSELAQAELIREMAGLSPAEQETLRAEAMRKIVETEKMEEKRRRKAAKIAHMARYNDLMTQSDKDFITRIQVSQLVTQDPFADDYYAQMFNAIQRSKQGLHMSDDKILKFGSGGGLALGAPQKGNTRRPNAMHRMEQQVERIVSNARKREEEKGLHALSSLQGALGKTSGRSYKAAPRQLLQVDSSNITSPTTEEGNTDPGSKSHQSHSIPSNLDRKPSLTKRQILGALEHLYDLELKLQNLSRAEPPPDDPESMVIWQYEYDETIEQTWKGFMMTESLETRLALFTTRTEENLTLNRDIHPFISLLSVLKGKRLLPRLTKHFDQGRQQEIFTLLVASFDKLDVVRDAAVLDSPLDSLARTEVHKQSTAFLDNVSQYMLPIIFNFQLFNIAGFLNLLLTRTDVLLVVKSRPGLSLLTLFFAHAQVFKQGGQEGLAQPTADDWSAWEERFGKLFDVIMPHSLELFPSTRILRVSTDVQTELNLEELDKPTWNLFSTIASNASEDQRHILVIALKDKILENVVSSRQPFLSEAQRAEKISNVNIFLNAVGLDASQIAV